MKFNNRQIKMEAQIEEAHNLIFTNNECINDINSQISKLKSLFNINDLENNNNLDKIL